MKKVKGAKQGEGNKYEWFKDRGEERQKGIKEGWCRIRPGWQGKKGRKNLKKECIRHTPHARRLPHPPSSTT